MTVGDIEGIVAKAVKAAVQVVREKFQNCLDVIKKDCDDLKSSCSFLETRKQSLENPDNSATAKDIAELSAKADALSSENRRLTIAVNDLDQQGHRHNIRIQGLIVKPGDNCSAMVKSLLQTKLNVDMKDNDIEAVYPIPSRRPTVHSGTDIRDDEPSPANANTILVAYDFVFARLVIK